MKCVFVMPSPGAEIGGPSREGQPAITRDIDTAYGHRGIGVRPCEDRGLLALGCAVVMFWMFGYAMPHFALWY